jgi:hypothetical protein
MYVCILVSKGVKQILERMYILAFMNLIRPGPHTRIPHVLTMDFIIRYPGTNARTERKHVAPSHTLAIPCTAFSCIFLVSARGGYV